MDGPEPPVIPTLIKLFIGAVILAVAVFLVGSLSLSVEPALQVAGGAFLVSLGLGALLVFFDETDSPDASKSGSLRTDATPASAPK